LVGTPTEPPSTKRESSGSCCLTRLANMALFVGDK
jgi:hypothetical protein